MYRTQRLVVYGAFCFAPVANRWHTVLNMIKVGGFYTSESRSFIARASAGGMRAVRAGPM